MLRWSVAIVATAAMCMLSRGDASASPLEFRHEQVNAAATYSAPEWWPLRGENKVGCARNSQGGSCDGYHDWWAIDVEGPGGQNVYASGSGIATTHSHPGTCAGYGRYVIVDHGPYGRSLYGHLSAFSVVNGEQVSRSTVIGKVGNTGYTEPCGYYHLHYEETNGSFGSGARDPGPLKACHGDTLVSYPAQWRRPSWNGLPGHTLIAESDGSACASVTPAPPEDSDEDGVPDSADECPTREGPPAQHGCPTLGSAAELTVGARSATSGDFNGDGYRDLAVGAPGEDIGQAINAGAVLVNYGGPQGLGSSGRQQLYSGPGGLNNTPETGDMLGAAVTAGDFNGDGHDDLAIGAPGEASGVSDGGLVLTIAGSPDGLDPTTSGGGRQGGLFANADETGDYLGAALTAGDFNGDGYDDLAAGTPGENSSVVDGGGVLTVNGSPGGLSSATAGGGRQGGLFANADETGDYLGAALTAGDFNGDGYDDLAAGAPGENSNAVDGGIVLTVNGSPGGLSSATAGGGRQGGLFANADETGDYLGAALTAGDFNGDGYGDLAAGAPGENSDAVDGGIVLTVNGSATGLNAATAGGGRQGGLFANTDEDGDYLGAALTAADFDRDGYDDLAAGAPGENGSAVDGGLVLTVNGSPGGLSSATAGGGRQGGLFANTDETGDYLGASLASGDFNGDCFDDLAAGTPGENSGVADGGGVLTVNGSASSLAAATAGGGRQGGFLAGADEAGDFTGGGSNGENQPPDRPSTTGGGEPQSDNVAPPPGGAQPLPRCGEAAPSGNDPPAAQQPPPRSERPPETTSIPGSGAPAGTVTISGRRVRVSRTGTASIRLACTGVSGDRCAGRIRLRTVTIRHRGRARRVDLGSAHFSIRTGMSRSVRLRLSAANRRLLLRRGTLTVSAAVTAADTAGRPLRASRRIVLLAARHTA